MADYATLLRDHTTLTCRSVDRFFLQGYVPKLQSVGRCAGSCAGSRGFPIPSSAAFGKIGDAYVNDVHRFAEDNGIPVRSSRRARARSRCPAADRGGRSEGGDGQGGADRDRPGEGVGVAVLAGQGPRKRGASAHGVGSADGLRQPLLLLHLGPRVGPGVQQDQRLCPLADLDLAERPRVGQAPVR